jgi:threonyl-tRNA synthetase
MSDHAPSDHAPSDHAPSDHAPSDRALYDHRKLGRELELFDTDPLIGAGLPYWLPAGAAVRHALEEYVSELERRAGYQHVYSPVLGKRELYEISGHWQHYRDGMYPPMTVGSGRGAEQVVLRPSLCPHHALMYSSRGRSYRELPLRLAELGGMYRSELSGVLGGLTRVRSIQLNDAHIFCTLEQVASEAAAVLGMIRQAYLALGIEPARYRLSLAGRSGKYVGGPEVWQQAAAILADVLVASGVEFEAEEGEAAFYGPKIDVQVADSAERETSLSTVQVDFYQPERFGLEYIGPDGGRHRPVMVHRSVIGSLERAVAHLIDVHGGAFPPWLAPVQLVALPISDAELPQAQDLARQAIELGLRAEIAAEGSLGARIRARKLVPYQAVIGATEAAVGEVALRLRDGRKLPPMDAAEALARISNRVAVHSPDLWQSQFAAG